MRSVSAFRSFFCILHTVNVFAGRNRRNAAVRARCHKLSYGFCSAIPCCKISGLEVLQSSPERIKPLSSSFTSSANTPLFGANPTAMNAPLTESSLSSPVSRFLTTIPESLPSPMKRATVLFRTGSMFAQAASPSATCFRHEIRCGGESDKPCCKSLKDISHPERLCFLRR